MIVVVIAYCGNDFSLNSECAYQTKKINIADNNSICSAKLTKVCDAPFCFKQKHSSTNHQDTIAYSRYIADCLVEVYHTSFLIPSFLAPIFRISIALIVMIMIIKLDAACSLASIYKQSTGGLRLDEVQWMFIVYDFLQEYSFDLLVAWFTQINVNKTT
ncbi:hypothetical protein POM88_038843 [Heracleum sosnowskyi]|uniref:Uncharacterized protein n=1 Tax=Heracleum sosnowskyi TaxID=360622 RepID=A0AAD8HBU9_9APIA|nr:hypothetical protein POM88_038843 [Heracleum sosnowskyi]